MADDKETKEEQAEIVYRYLSEENPNNASYPGVPLGDILAHHFEQLPKWIQNSIAESKMYKKVEPKKAKAAPRAKAKPKAKAAPKSTAKPKPAPAPAPLVVVEQQQEVPPDEGKESEK